MMDDFLFTTTADANKGKHVLIQMKQTLFAELKTIFLMLSDKPVTILLCGSMARAEAVAVQVEAVMEASLAAAREDVLILPRLLIPSTSSECEMWRMAALIHSTASPIVTAALASTSAAPEPPEQAADGFHYEVGVMLRTPRACIRARHIASQASSSSTRLKFITFDADNLTELVWGLKPGAEECQFNIVCQTPSGKSLNMISPFRTIDQQVSTR
jgi:hypothetical protein